MGFDIVLIALVIGGIALSGAYVRAEYIAWREHGAMQRRREAALHERHAASLSEQRDALLPSVLKLQGFCGERAAANPEASDEYAAARRASSLSNSARNFSVAERRKRARQRTTH
jgi:hypothetical protein